MTITGVSVINFHWTNYWVVGSWRRHDVHGISLWWNYGTPIFFSVQLNSLCFVLCIIWLKQNHSHIAVSNVCYGVANTFIWPLRDNNWYFWRNYYISKLRETQTRQGEVIKLRPHTFWGCAWVDQSRNSNVAFSNVICWPKQIDFHCISRHEAYHRKTYRIVNVWSFQVMFAFIGGIVDEMFLHTVNIVSIPLCYNSLEIGVCREGSETCR